MMNKGVEQSLLSLPDYALNSEVKDLEMRINDQINSALRYACWSWHSHLTKAEGDITDVVSCLCVFLEEKFLVWLEVVSAIGAVGGGHCWTGKSDGLATGGLFLAISILVLISTSGKQVIHW